MRHRVLRGQIKKKQSTIIYINKNEQSALLHINKKDRRAIIQMNKKGPKGNNLDE